MQTAQQKKLDKDMMLLFVQTTYESHARRFAPWWIQVQQHDIDTEFTQVYELHHTAHARTLVFGERRRLFPSFPQLSGEY